MILLTIFSISINVTGCQSCHTRITKFDDIIASFDYDGSGVTEAFISFTPGRDYYKNLLQR